MVWAVWTFHGEVHGPKDCADFTCFCGKGGLTEGCHQFPGDTCMPDTAYNTSGCPLPGPCGQPPVMCDGWNGTVAQSCGDSHAGDDPQFLSSLSSTGYQSSRNDEIDIEIPANCVNTPNVCSNGSCAGDYSTANLNNYLYSNGNGGGDQYANMCVKVTDRGNKGKGNATEEPRLLLGDGKYHTYAFDWHTGNGTGTEAGYVDFYIDDVYLGTNNAFVPTRASRLWIALWEGSWNGDMNSWGGGSPGDGLSYSQDVLVSHVKVTPFNEANDIAYPSFIDQPEGCTPSKYAPSWWGCNRALPLTLPVPGGP